MHIPILQVLRTECPDVSLSVVDTIHHPPPSRINHVILLGPLSKGAPPEVCKAWFAYQGLSTLGLLEALNLILMLRGMSLQLQSYDLRRFNSPAPLVYAFYNCSHSVGIVLALLFVGDISVSIFALIGTLKNEQYDLNCMAHDTPRQVLYFSCVQAIPPCRLFRYRPVEISFRTGHAC